MTSTARLDFRKASPGALQAMFALEKHIATSSIDTSLLELIKVRASQINGCAYCLDLHAREARKGGETEQRIYALSAWRETPYFTERERAALAWTEAVTLIAFERVPDALFEEAHAQFSDTELVDMTVAVIAINGWNRLAVAFRLPPSPAQSEAKAVAA